MGAQRYPLIFLLLFASLLQACKKSGNVQSAFYYWKTSFTLDTQQATLLKNTANNHLYLRFFDITWDEGTHRAFPKAIVNFKQPVTTLSITPVIYITNKTFEQIKDNAIDSLAINANGLISRIAEKNNVTYQTIQVDCDWTLSTREKYFKFLLALKNINHLRLEATIRLHQVKYKERTGVPPVDKGILMFYNMGKISDGLQQASSIYNERDAGKYITYAKQYPLLLDIALPLFSWSIQVREGRVIQVYAGIGRKLLNNPLNFEQTGHLYRSKKSFFLNGIYIKENDIFKLEETDLNALKKAAKQLEPYLPAQKNRTIIYYELSNLNQSFKAQALNQISADF